MVYMSSYYNQLWCFFLFSYMFFFFIIIFIHKLTAHFSWNNKLAVNHCRIVSNLNHFSALLCLFGRSLSLLLMYVFLWKCFVAMFFIVQNPLPYFIYYTLQPLIITMPHSIQSMSTDMHIFIVACIVSFHYTPHISSLFAIYHNRTKYAFWFILSGFFIYAMSALTITINFP